MKKMDWEREFFLVHPEADVDVARFDSSSFTRERKIIFREVKWITDLTLPEGETMVRSPIYTLDGPIVTKWQIELNPNFVDSQGTRYLSFWVRLLESTEEKVAAGWEAMLDSKTSDDDYVKEATRLTYTKREPSQGFPKFIEMYRVESDANPMKNRFQFQLQLHIFLLPKSIEPEVEPEADQDSETEIDIPKPPVTLDGSVIWNRIEFMVDSNKLSEYSFVFKRRFQRSENNSIDVTSFFETKCMLEYILKFCHFDGMCVKFPKRPQGVKKVAQMSTRLGMPSLRDVCHKRVIEELQPKNFTEIVELVKDDFLDAKVIMPWMIEFLFERYDEIVKEDVLYAERHKKNKKLLRRFYRKKPKWDSDSDSSEDDESCEECSIRTLSDEEEDSSGKTVFIEEVTVETTPFTEENWFPDEPAF